MASGEEEFIQSLREDGTGDWIRARIGEGLNHETAEDVSSSTVEQPRDPDTGQFVAEQEAETESTEAEEPGEQPEHPEDPEETPEDEMFLDLTPEAEELLAKHDGDLNKVLAEAAWLNQLRGRQGNEIGELKAELERMREAIESRPDPVYTQPVQWPSEDMIDDDPQAASEKYASIAYDALRSRNADMLGEAIEGWKEVDPFGAAVFVSDMRVAALQPAAPEATPEPSVEDAFAALEAKHPDIRQHGDLIAAEAERWPTLARRLEEGTDVERVQALGDLYELAQRRTSSENAEAALRRVRITTSEEARQARQSAQVAQGGSRGNAETTETPERKIPFRTSTGDARELDLNRVDELIDEQSSQAPIMTVGEAIRASFRDR